MVPDSIHLLENKMDAEVDAQLALFVPLVEGM